MWLSFESLIVFVVLVERFSSSFSRRQVSDHIGAIVVGVRVVKRVVEYCWIVVGWLDYWLVGLRRHHGVSLLVDAREKLIKSNAVFQ